MKKIALLIVAMILALPGMAQKKSELASQIHSLDSALQAQNVVIQSLNANVLQLTTLCGNQTMQINALSDSLRTMRNLRDSIRTLRRDLAELSKQYDAKIATLSKQIADLPAGGNNATPEMKTQKDTIINIINQFVTAYNDGNKEEWLKYVLHPEQVGKLSFSKERVYSVSAKAPVKPFTYKSNSWFEVSETYFVKKEGNTYKIDFESSFAYNKTTLKEFEITKHTTPHTFRVELRLDSYTYSEVFSEDKYYCFHSEDASTNSVLLYVRKNTEVGKKLYELTKRGEDVKVIVEAKYVREQNTEYYDIQPVITRVIQEGWITE